jgi:primase-polymerase (primpol)-like protein
VYSTLNGKPKSILSIPEALRDLPRWACWRYEGENGKPSFIPSTDRYASPTDPKTWGALTRAWNARDRYDGLSFALDERDGLVGIDLDDCRDDSSGAIQPWALEIVRSLDSYTEVTPSGKGLRVFVRGHIPVNHRKKIDGGEIEVYSKSKFLSVTGHRLEEYPETIENRQAALDALYAKYWPDTGYKSNGSPKGGILGDWEPSESNRIPPRLPIYSADSKTPKCTLMVEEAKTTQPVRWGWRTMR